jgi:Ser/Thr protein kinase RdoA (MazF antagonist)
MMTLSRMKALFYTIDDQWRSPVAEEVLASWEHEPGSARVINASSNFVFSFRARGEQRILRFVVDEIRPAKGLYPSDWHSPAAILAELDFIRYLVERGIRAAQPLVSLSGKWVETVDTQIGRVHASVFEYMTGETCEFEELPLERYPDWGKAIAELHNAAQGYSRPGATTWMGR